MGQDQPAATGQHENAYFDGKTALLFGAARNIGRAIAMEFARRGARVAIADLDLAGAEEAAQLITAHGGEAIAIACDVTDGVAVHDAAIRTQSRFGEPDIVVNNAGLLKFGSPEDFSLHDWQRTMDCNVFSIIRTNEIFLPRMIARGHGHLVNTASFAGLYPYGINRLPYAASKAAVVSLSENLAIYLEPKGVRVTCLCPGPVTTTMAHGLEGLKPGSVMTGPGSNLTVQSQDETAHLLADAMTAGEIVVLTHAEGFETLRDHAASPDTFIRAKIAAFARGDTGLPSRAGR